MPTGAPTGFQRAQHFHGRRFAMRAYSQATAYLKYLLAVMPTSSTETQCEFLVIGSGPSGVAAAAAVLDAGRTVAMLDIADDLSAAARTRIAGLAQQEPDTWQAVDRRWMQDAADVRAVPLKNLFGETFMYDQRNELPRGFDQWPSRALGGLSRVWGATLKRLDASGFADWPVTGAEMAPHYAAVEALLGDIGPPMSGEAGRLLREWQSRAGELNGLGARVMPSALAVARDCKRCGMCLTGCPYGYIFSTDHLIERYRNHPRFRFYPGLAVRHMVEREGRIELLAEAHDGLLHRYAAGRVFVAAGPLATARLMLASFGQPGEELVLRDSQYFLLPFFSSRRAGGEDAHVLSQLFLQFLHQGAPIHAQLYGHNAHYGPAIAARLGLLGQVVRPLTSWLGRHLVVAQGYLPSELSGTAHLSLAQDALRIVPRPSSLTRPALRGVGEALARIGRLAKLRTLPALLEQTGIGRGYHSGATLPMTKRPIGWQTDTLGRARGLERVHVVDASVWPNIPSGPVTLTTMANAHRIASDAARLDIP